MPISLLFGNESGAGVLDFSHFKGTRFMLRGAHPWAGWIGRFVEMRKFDDGRLRTVPVLVLEARDPDKRKEVFIFEAGHVRLAGDTEIGKGGQQ